MPNYFPFLSPRAFCPTERHGNGRRRMLARRSPHLDQMAAGRMDGMNKKWLANWMAQWIELDQKPPLEHKIQPNFLLANSNSSAGPAASAWTHSTASSPTFPIRFSSHFLLSPLSCLILLLWCPAESNRFPLPPYSHSKFLTHISRAFFSSLFSIPLPPFGLMMRGWRFAMCFVHSCCSPPKSFPRHPSHP